MTRVCNKCGQEMQLESFSKDKRRPLGRAYTCKRCVVENTKKWYRSNKSRALANSEAWRKANKDKVKAKRLVWYRKNAEHIRSKVNERRRNDPHRKEKERWKWILLNYGLTKDEWVSLFESQGQKCGCCGSADPLNKRGWHTDHCHETGKVRGIVCQPCNSTLGSAREDKNRLQACISYLGRYEKD